MFREFDVGNFLKVIVKHKKKKMDSFPKI
jgi:hypothetical protein